MGKVFERCMFKYIFNYLRDNKLISVNQSGFIPGDSTVNQLVSIHHDICMALENHTDIQLIFFDISKAFDKVWHKGLLHKLKCIGIKGPLFNLLSDYLYNRKQRVVLNGTCSSWQNIQAGVPQGSVLGPILFLIYINDIGSNLLSKASLFADDTSLSKHITDPIISNSEIQDDLNTIQSWATKWQVTFNPLKSEALMIALRPNRYIHDFTFQNHSINNVDTHKHLGLIWNNDVSWKSHLSTVISKASKRIDMLRALKFKLDRTSLEKIYFAFIRPIFEYASVVWDSAPRHLYIFTNMEKLQIAAARVVTGTNSYSSKHLLYHDTGWDLLSTRRERQRLILFFKIINGLAPPHLCKILDSYLIDNQRYNFRSPNIPNPLSRTETYRCSFFPSAIRAWNSLDSSIKNARTVSEFKMKINKPLVHNIYYTLGSRCVNAILASMRMQCCQLNSHLFTNNISPNKFCNCGEEETIFHFFFECRDYINSRDILLNETMPFTTLSIIKILHGDKSLCTRDITKLHEAVSKYIVSSKRFAIY